MGYLKQRIQNDLQLPNLINKVAGFPKNSLVELTNGCNHACLFCKNSNQHRRIKNLPLDKFEKFIKQATLLDLEEVGLYATGEPFMVKNLNEYIKIAKNNGVRRVYLTTNGSLASIDKVIQCYNSGLNSIKFSINAANRDDYKFVHGQDDFDQVLQNVKDIFKWKEENNINLQMLASCVMVPSLPNMQEKHYEIFKPYFEDIIYVNASSQLGQAFTLIDELSVSPHGVFNKLGKENYKENIKPCSMIWNRYHLTAEGYLSACCVDYELDLVIADLNVESLEKAWNNNLAKQLRQAHISGNLKGLLCDQCMHNKKAPYSPISDVKKSLKSIQLINRERKKLKDRIILANKKVS